MGPDSNLYDLLESLAQLVKIQGFSWTYPKELVLGNNSIMHFMHKYTMHTIKLKCLEWRGKEKLKEKEMKRNISE